MSWPGDVWCSEQRVGVPGVGARLSSPSPPGKLLRNDNDDKPSLGKNEDSPV